MGSQYSKDDHAKAANLYIHVGKSYGDLTDVDGLPNSKGTFAKWAEDGKGTGGTAWDEVVELIEKEEQAVRRKDDATRQIQTAQEVADRLGPLLAEAADNLRRQLMNEGDGNPTYTKYADLLERLDKVARQQHVAEIHDRLEELAKQIGNVLGREISDETLARRMNAEIEAAFADAYNDIDDLLGING